MKKTIVLTTLMITVMSLGMAQTQESLDQARNSYNNNSDQLPGFLASIVGGERINLEINESGEVTEIGIVMEGVEAKKVQRGGVENATMNAYVHTDTLENISESEQPLQRTVDAVKSEEIEYSATTTTGKVKLAVVDIFTDLVDLLL